MYFSNSLNSLYIIACKIYQVKARLQLSRHASLSPAANSIQVSLIQAFSSTIKINKRGYQNQWLLCYKLHQQNQGGTASCIALLTLSVIHCRVLVQETKNCTQSCLCADLIITQTGYCRCQQVFFTFLSRYEKSLHSCDWRITA